MKVLTGLDRDTMARCQQQEEFFWLDLLRPEPELLESVGEVLHWHPLLIEDLQHGGQRPKIEDFADHAFVISYSAAVNAAGEIDLFEHALVVHGDYLVTVRHGGDPVLDHLRSTLEAGADGVSEGAVVHRVLDLIVDSTTVVADTIAARVDHLEQDIDRDSNDQTLEHLRSSRRDLVSLRAAAAAQRDALASLASALEAIPGFEVGMRSHFRDITDHAHRVVDRLDVSRALLDAAFEAYYTMLVARQGAVTQRLTVIATIFLPLTFVTGFFGQNFTWMVDHVASERDFLMFGVGATAATGLALALVFWRLKWW